MQHDDDAKYHSNQNFALHVVGSVRIPVSDEWRLKGFMASQSYLFPGEEMDDTYKQLPSSNVSDLAQKIEQDHRLPARTLGRTAVY